MRKSSIDRPWARQEAYYTVASVAMRGFNLKIWRTDGVAGPPKADDLRMMVSHTFDKYQVTHLRNYHGDGPSTTYDVAVETMPTLPELPEDAAEVAEVLSLPTKA